MAKKVSKGLLKSLHVLHTVEEISIILIYVLVISLGLVIKMEVMIESTTKREREKTIDFKISPLFRSLDGCLLEVGLERD